MADSSSSSSSSSSGVGREYGDEDVLVAVGHLLNDAVDPLGAAAEFPRGKGDPMRLLRRLEACPQRRQRGGGTATATATAAAAATATAPPRCGLRTATIPSAT